MVHRQIILTYYQHFVSLYLSVIANDQNYLRYSLVLVWTCPAVSLLLPCPLDATKMYPDRAAEPTLIFDLLASPLEKTKSRSFLDCFDTNVGTPVMIK